jgi:flagellar basal body-associated protein FliL
VDRFAEEGVIFLKLFLAMLSLATSIFVWWMKNDSEKKKKVSDERKEIKDAVNSGDVARINAVIQRLRS